MYRAILVLQQPADMQAIEAYCGDHCSCLMLFERLTDSVAFLDHIRVHPVDVAFIDLMLGGTAGAHLLRSLSYHQPHCIAVGVLNHEQYLFSHLREAQSQGIHGLLLSPFTNAQLEETMRTISGLLQQAQMQEELLKRNTLSTDSEDSSQGLELAGQIHRFIVKNHVEPLMMADIVHTFFISESYVNRILMKHHGKSFKKILTEIRIQHARELMNEHPLMSISDIAHAVGYSDSHYFSRMYKAFTGISPSFDRGAPGIQEVDHE